jgi:hypothetical protein
MPSTPTHAPDQVLGRLSTHVTPACFRSLPTLAFTTLASSLYRRGRPWPSAPLQTHLLSRYCHSCPLYAIPLLARRQHGRGGGTRNVCEGVQARAHRSRTQDVGGREEDVQSIHYTPGLHRAADSPDADGWGGWRSQMGQTPDKRSNVTKREKSGQIDGQASAY